MPLTELAHPVHPLPDLVVSVSSEGPATVIALRGEADSATLALVVDALDRVLAGSGGPVVVDLAETAFMDSGTFRTLGQYGQRLSDRGRPLTLRSPSKIAVRVLALLGLSLLVDPGGPAQR